MKVISKLQTYVVRVLIFFGAFVVGQYAALLFQVGYPHIPEPDLVMPILQNVQDYKPTKSCKRDPLMLVLEINEYGALRLNTDAVGSVRDTAPLRKYLKDVFMERHLNGVFNEDGDLQAKVVIMPAPNVTGAELANIVEVLNGVRAGPLYMDWNRRHAKFFFSTHRYYKRSCGYTCVPKGLK